MPSDLTSTYPQVTSQTSLQSLLHIIDYTVYHNSQAPAESSIPLHSLLRLLEGLQAWLSHAHAADCGFSRRDLASPHLALRLLRVHTDHLPASLSLRNATVWLPPALRAEVAAGVQAPGGMVDVVLQVASAAPPLVTDLLTLHFYDTVTARPIAVDGLTEPATLALPLPAPPLPYAPVDPWYQCVYEVRASNGSSGGGFARLTGVQESVADGWAADGVWLVESAAAASALVCQTTHLSTFSVSTVAQVTGVSGCPLDARPATLFCPQPASDSQVVVRGRNLGAAGAAVSLRTADGAWECREVSHGGPAGAEEELRCSGLVAAVPGSVPGPPDAAPWASVTVTTAFGQAHTLERAVLFAPAPRLFGFAPASNCGYAGAAALAACPPGGARFAVVGAGLRGYGATEIWVGALRCPDVVHNATHAECAGLAGPGGRELPLRVVVAGTPAAAHAGGLTVSFVDPCAAKAGRWAGADCDECQPGFWGRGCRQLCPGAAVPPPGAVVSACGGHGTCDDGLNGAGVCACDRTAVTGHWAGANCSDCADGYYGPACTRRCPGHWPAAGEPQVCLNRGTCDGGVRGTGACECGPGYAGRACDLLCPAVGGAVCNGHGGCVPTEHAGFGACVCAADAVVGVWAGHGCTVCAAGWLGPACRIACPGAGVAGGRPCSGHGACSLAPDNATAACACAAGYVGEACAAACPRSRDGVICGGHGVCGSLPDAGAACACVADPATGFWTGPACAACSAGWAGGDCKRPCPRDTATGAVCGARGACVRATGECLCDVGHCGPTCGVSGAACGAFHCGPGRYGPGCARVCDCAANGTCLAGVLGSGTCVCDAGWVGARCDATCVGGPDNVCGGHGRCLGDGGGCDCDAGWRIAPSTGACALQCPGVPADPCSGHGVCGAAAMCTCDPGYFGPDCGLECPADAALRPCSGHGACDAARGGCACARDAVRGYWAGRTCSVCTNGHAGPDCTGACVAGVTVQRACVCDAGYFGANCSHACPGPPGDPCGGHGTCDDGGAGTGRCTCDAGYAGSSCGMTCPGGVPNPCSGHGTCSAKAGTCVCQQTSLGHYAGPACERCRVPYFGANCTLRCPDGPDGRPCSGHGTCTASAKCSCSCNSLAGCWAGEACDACRPGHWGPACRRECPGGACNPCAGHGTCSDGLEGNGTCACQFSAAHGYFVGAACASCVAGYWGPSCRDACPGGAAAPCNGHGACSTGPSGSGLCTCDSGPDAGYWAGSACTECQPGYYGAGCAGTCPGAGTVELCSGHGACDDGPGGDGTCVCANWFTGAVCAIACPRVQGRVCNGHGACAAAADGGAECACASGTATGAWAGPLCTACAAGHFGADCAGECPGGSRRPCSRHGVCADGVAGNGTCACALGWAAPDCSVPCPGPGPSGPCSGHGLCDPATAVCVCEAGNGTGHWSGDDCGRCAAGWSGPGCDVRCPTGPQGVVCSGAGVCGAGACHCDAGRCGVACERGGAACDPLRCPSGFWGSLCDGLCPGLGLGGGVPACSGHGACANSRLSAGECMCAAGWSGPDCATPCPGAPACSGHGRCDARAHGCQCEPRYAGPACDVACAGGVVQPCNGHGVCASESGGDGSCACDVGYFGSACDGECPGGAMDPCSGHGQCSPVNGTCRCATPWVGADCADCAPGWYGEVCQQRCANGRSEARLCLCLRGWFGPGCASQCPGGWQAPCSGHGACDPGSGACACDVGWLTALCDLPCPGLEETGLPCAGHGQCVNSTTCRCARDPVEGYWNGPTCETCVPGWFGATCDRTCPRSLGVPCGGHGTCDAATETCQCHRDPGLGFWDAAANCTECVAAYFGPGCARECPGGACNPCYGHGTCDDGVGGTGQCECDPRWRGAECHQCAFGWFSQVWPLTPSGLSPSRPCCCPFTPPPPFPA